LVLFHLAAAAFLAISERFLAERAFALAVTPLSPPLRPSSAAALLKFSDVVLGSSPVIEYHR